MVPGPVHRHGREHGPRPARQGPRDPAGADLPGLRGPPAPRGPARHRQDDAGPRARQHRRGLARAHPVHAGPAAHRRHRRHRLRPAQGRLRVPPRPDLPRHRARRRDQPRLPQDPVGAAGGHGGGSRHRRRHDVRRAPALHGDRHHEPDRAGRHLPAARGPAGPVPDEDLDRLPRRRVDRGAAPGLPPPRPRRAGQARHHHRPDRRARRAGRRRARRPGRGPLRPRARGGLPGAAARPARAECARLPRPDPGGQDLGRLPGAHGRRPRGHREASPSRCCATAFSWTRRRSSPAPRWPAWWTTCSPRCPRRPTAAERTLRARRAAPVGRPRDPGRPSPAPAARHGTPGHPAHRPGGVRGDRLAERTAAGRRPALRAPADPDPRPPAPAFDPHRRR